MRVAWQAGVVRALVESGLTFAHGDGTSGGIMNLGMLLSGVPAEEMGERWRTLDVTDFVSLLPLTDYLSGPTNLPAMGDADGVIDKVFPHLGIDVDRIHAAEGMVGTFNVCDFGRKTCVAVPHTDVHLDHLVAGMSLPLFMPPVQRDGVTWTDAVWIKDANLTEAVRRGAEEIWLAWCIGNSPRYGDGPLEQYVHMIEMSANGALFVELELIAEVNERRARGEEVHGSTRPIRLHVVKPDHPLPLDPELYLGRIDAAALVAMGYRDASRYLAAMTPEGVGLDPDATAMRDLPLGLRFRETLRGDLTFGSVAGVAELDLAVEVRDIDAFAAAPAAGVPLAGRLQFSGWPVPRLLTGGTFRVQPAGDGSEGRTVAYECRLLMDGAEARLVATKDLHDDPGFDLLGDVSTARVEVSAGGASIGSGVLKLGLGDLARMVRSIEPSGAHGLRDRASAVAALGRLLVGDLWDTYA